MKFLHYEIKFGIEATTKSGILKRVKETQEKLGEDTLDNIDLLLDITPELILVGLQRKYSKEFGYNYSTEEGKDEALRKVYDLFDEYMDQDDSSIFDLFNALGEELVVNGFFKRQLAMKKEEEKTEKNKEKTEK